MQLTVVLSCSGAPESTVPFRGQFSPQNDGTLVGHMSAIPEYLRRFFSDALAVVIPVSRYASSLLFAHAPVADL